MKSAEDQAIEIACPGLSSPGESDTSRARQPAVEPDYGHPLLQPLSQAQEALTRLETRAETASEAVAEGLRARLPIGKHAAGWRMRMFRSIRTTWRCAIAV